MINKDILIYFSGLKPPKGTHIFVNNEILITSTNTNPFEIGFYIVLICFDLYITFVSQFWHGLWLGGFFGLMLWINYKSKTLIRFTPKEVIIKDGLMFKPYDFPLSEIEYVDFRGIWSTSVDKSERTCTRIKIKDDLEYGCFLRTANQKFLYRCLEYYFKNYNKYL